MNLKRVLIMAGGTGGHVFPALAVAHALQEKGIAVHWLGTEHGLEARVVKDAGLPISFIKISGLRGNGLMRLLFAPIKISHAIIQSLKVLRQYNPGLVIGMGGFVTGPGGVAARLSRRKLIIHEQNAIVGLTNKWLSKISTRVLQAFPTAFKNSKKVFTVGNPVRSTFNEISNVKRDDDELHVLVVGGSLGAQALNEVMPKVENILKNKINLKLWHQTGRDKLESTTSAYVNGTDDIKLVEFIDDMAAAYQWADLVICRAGAMTISELTSAGRTAVLVPYPHAVDDHQTENAKFLSDADAAYLIPQSELDADKLSELIIDLTKNGKEKILLMSENSKKLNKANATKDIVSHCLEVCHGTT